MVASMRHRTAFLAAAFVLLATALAGCSYVGDEEVEPSSLSCDEIDALQPSRATPLATGLKRTDAEIADALLAVVGDARTLETPIFQGRWDTREDGTLNIYRNAATNYKSLRYQVPRELVSSEADARTLIQNVVEAVSGSPLGGLKVSSSPPDEHTGIRGHANQELGDVQVGDGGWFDVEGGGYLESGSGETTITLLRYYGIPEGTEGIDYGPAAGNAVRKLECSLQADGRGEAADDLVAGAFFSGIEVMDDSPGMMVPVRYGECPEGERGVPHSWEVRVDAVSGAILSVGDEKDTCEPRE